MLVRMVNLLIFQDCQARRRAFVQKGLHAGMNLMPKSHYIESQQPPLPDPPNALIVGNIQLRILESFVQLVLCYPDFFFLILLSVQQSIEKMSPERSVMLTSLSD